MICRLLARAQQGDDEAMLELINRFQPLLKSMQNSYDENGRLIEQTDAVGNSTKMSYDACGRMN